MQDRLSHATKKFREWALKVENHILRKDYRLRSSCQRLINWAKEIRELDEAYYAENIHNQEFSLLSQSIPLIHEEYTRQYLKGSRKHGQFTKIRQEKVASYVYQFAAFLLPIAEEINAIEFLNEKIGEFISKYSSDLLFDLTNIGDHEADALLEIALKAEELKIKSASSLRNTIESEIMRRQLADAFIADLSGESVQVEYKSDVPTKFRKLSKEIAAFASTEGGRIYIGISDQGQIIGINNKKEQGWLDRFQQNLMNFVYENVKPTPTLSVDELSIRDKMVIQITVEKGPEPMYYLRNVPYVRRLTTSRPATPSDVKNHYLGYFIQSLKKSAL